jgi:large subunit ribosomal protein L10
VAKVEEKKPVVQAISDAVNGAASVVVVDYRGLTVTEDTELRRTLRENNVAYKVYKNTMMNFAFKGTEFEALSDVLEGPNAIAVSKDDATAPARILAEFAKKAPNLEIKAGVVEGQFYDAEGMKAISSIPSREELLSRLLGSLQSPITNLARVLNQIAEKGGASAEAPAAAEAPAEEAAPTEEAAPAESTEA